jgi:hypothetical protein
LCACVNAHARVLPSRRRPPQLRRRGSPVPPTAPSSTSSPPCRSPRQKPLLGSGETLGSTLSRCATCCPATGAPRCRRASVGRALLWGKVSNTSRPTSSTQWGFPPHVGPHVDLAAATPRDLVWLSSLEHATLSPALL